MAISPEEQKIRGITQGMDTINQAKQKRELESQPGALEQQGYGSPDNPNSMTSAIMSGYMQPLEAEMGKEVADVVKQQKAGTLADTQVDTQVSDIENKYGRNAEGGLGGFGGNQQTVTPVLGSEQINQSASTSASSSSDEPAWIADIRKFNKLTEKQMANTETVSARGGATTGIDSSVSGDISGTGETTTPQPTGAYGGAFANAEQQLLINTQLENQNFLAAEEQRRIQMARSLAATDAGQREIANGENLASWTMADLEALWVNEVGDLSESNKDKIRAGRKPELDMLNIERTFGLAENEYQRNSIEREFGRAITDREEFNARQDAKEERLLAAYGGARAMSNNVAILKNQESRQRELDYLTSEYVDRLTLVSSQAQTIHDKYTVKARAIEQEINSSIEEAYTNITNKVDELIGAGITNQQDLNEALAEDFAEYAKTYADLTEKQLNYELDLNDQLLEEEKTFKDYVLKVDKQYSDITGYVYKNGAPLVDMNGNQIRTVDYTLDANDQDIKMMQNTGIFWKNGQMVFDPTGQPVNIPLGLMDEISYNSTETKMLLDSFGFDLDNWKAMDASQRAWFQAQVDYQQERRLSEEAGVDTGLMIPPERFSSANGEGGAIDTGLSLHTLGYGTRADRHLNPIASKAYDNTIALLENAGLVEGEDWFVGETTQGIDSDAVPTIGYPNAESALKGTIATLEGGQMGTWYANPKYKGGSQKVLAKLTELTGQSVNPSNAQQVFNSMPYEQQVEIVKTIYSHEGGTKLFQ